MPSPSVTYTLTNGTTADATQVQQNFTDLINALTDGLKDITIGTLAVNGNVTLGDASSDVVTFTASLGSTILPSVSNTYDLGSSSFLFRSLYWGTQSLAPNGTFSAPAYAWASSTTSGFFRTSATITSYVNNGGADWKFAFEGRSSNGGANVVLSTSLTTSKDQWITFQEGNTDETADSATIWSIGRDDSASGAFKISQNATLGTNDFLTCTTAGAWTLGAPASSQAHTWYGASWTFQASDIATLQIYNIGTDDDSILKITNNGSSTGDQYISLFEGGDTANAWTMGRDDSASGGFALSLGATLGTSNFLSCTTAGAWTLGASSPAAGAFHTINVDSATNTKGLVFNERTATSSTIICRGDVNTGAIKMAGGGSGANGGYIAVYGASHASLANNVEIGNGASVTGFVMNAAGAVTLGTSGGTQTHIFNGLGQFLSTGAQAVSVDTSGSGSVSRLLIRNTHATVAGNVGLAFSKTAGGIGWHVGVDGASSDALVFGGSATIGTSIFGSISVAGLWTIGTGTSTQHAINTLLATNGAQTATMTNLPAAATAGNPAVWIKITVNGSTRYIPAWA